MKPSRFHISIPLVCILFTLMMALSFSIQAREKRKKRSKAPVGQATIIVVANDEPETLRMEGRDVLVINPKKARAMGLHSVADVLKFQAELNLITTGVMPGSVTSAFIRGGESSYTLIVIDDVEVNSIGGFYDLGSLPLDNIERIEILKGPGSTIYGSEAVSGVIRIYTRKGGARHKTRLSAQGGSFSTFEEHLQNAGPLAGPLHYSVSIGRIDSDRQRPVNDRYRRTNASVSLGAEYRNGHSWNLNYRVVDARTHFPTQNAGDLFDVLDPGQFTDSTEHIFSFRWNGHWTPALESRITVGYYRADLDFVDEDDGPEIDPFGGFRSNTKTNRWRVDGRIVYRTGPHRVTLGLNYERERLETSNLFQPNPQNFDRNTFSGYVLEQYTGMNGRLGITAGIRLESHEDYDNVVAPQFSLAFWPSKTVKFHGSIGYGYKAPSFFQVHGLPGFAEGNPNLKPERNIGWDAGVEYWKDEAYPLLKVTYFENHFEDIIEFVFDLDPTTPNFFNVQAAVARGLEIGLEYHWKTWQLRAAYTYTHTETTDAGLAVAPGDAFIEGEPLLRRPRHRFTGSIGYEKGRLAAFVDLLYQGSRWDLDFSQGFVPVRVELDAYTRVDARVRYQLTQFLGVFVRFENLLDKTYQEVFGFRGPGFGAYGGLDVTF